MGKLIKIQLGICFSLLTIVCAFNACNANMGTNGPSSSYAAPLVTGLQVSPAVSNVGAYQTQFFNVTGGRAPYHFIITSGTGQVDYHSGVFSSMGVSGQTTILVGDATGESAMATVNITGNGTTAPPTTQTGPATNCSVMLNQPYSGFEDASGSGLGNIMSDQSLNDPSSCSSWCGSIGAGYCEWSPNNGTPVCVAWAFGSGVVQYSSSWPTYAGACQ